MSEKATETKQAGQELALRPPDHLTELARLGQWMAFAEADDRSEKGRGATAALRLYYAEQLQLPPLAANDLVMIKGRLFVQSNVLRALARRQGYRVEKADASRDACTAVLYNGGGEEIGRETYTLEQARDAGIVREKSAWTTHPDRMLWARASSFVIRDYAPEVALGIGIVEEIGDFIEGVAVELPDEEPDAPESEPEEGTA